MEKYLDLVVDWLGSFSAFIFLLSIYVIWKLIQLFWRTVRKWVPSVKLFIEFYEALISLPKFMSATTATLGQISHEVFPNGGGSMRDDVVSLKLMSESIKIQMKTLTNRDEKDHRRLAEIEAMLNIRNGKQEERDNG